MNNEDLNLLGIKFETRTEYAIEYIEEILKEYKRLRRKGIENVMLEFTLIACGFNLYKYHNKINRIKKYA